MPIKRARPRKVSEPDPDEIRAEYDFSEGVRNPYADRFRTGAIAVVLDPDVADRFPNARAVNDALRSLGKPSRTKRGKRGARRSA